MNLFENVNAEARVWMKDLMSEGRISDAEDSLHLLGAGLRAIRERLTVAEAAQLGARLPLLVRGMFFQDWNPAAHSAQTKGELLAMVRERCFAPSAEPLSEVAAVVLFRVIEHQLSGAEPAALGDFRFDAAVSAHGLGQLWAVVPPAAVSADRARIGAV
jgi:uncharacterized protein (DUF2267 family)